MEQKINRETFSKAMLGGRNRVPILEAISSRTIVPPQPFQPSELRAEIGHDRLPNSSLYREIDRLAELRMIERLHEPDNNRVRYIRVDSPFWDIVKVALDAAQMLPPSSNS
jgi:hypothetical protein